MTTRTIRAAVLAGCAALIGATFVATPAWADEVSCTGSLGAVTVDNLRVPQDAACTLTGTVVKGNITVQSRARLDAVGVRVVGNVQAENAASVVLRGSSQVGGNVQVKQGGSASVTQTAVTGDIQYDLNRGPLVADDNRVGGNIQIFENFGGATVNRNTVDGNLQCKENSPAPTGGGNVVRGSVEDQCRQMAPTPTTPGTPPAPGTQPGATAPTVTVKVKPVSKRGKLFVDVNPNRGKGHWTFRVERLSSDGTWQTLKKTHKTKGKKETRTINYKKGTYRAVVNAKYGYQGTTSAAVSLRR